MNFLLLHGAEARLIDLALGTSGNIPLQLFVHKVTELVKQACNDVKGIICIEKVL